MANVDIRRGLKPVRYMNGTPWNGKFTMYYSSGASAIYKGALVKHSGTGYTDGKTPGCTLAGAGDPPVGVVIGFANQKNVAAYLTDLDKAYVPASAACYVAVVDDPNVLFEVQEDNGSSAHLAVTDIGQFVPIVNNSSGDTTTGWSYGEIDSDGAAASASSATLQIMGVVDREDNEIGSSADYAKWLVRIADHHFKSVTVSA